MAAAAAPGSVLSAIVADDALMAAIPSDAVAKIEDEWSRREREVQAEKIRVEKESVAKDNRFFELEQELNLVRQKYDAKLAETDDSTREKSSLSARCSELRQQLDSSEETRSSLEVENGSLKRERDQLAAERNDLFELAERRQQEVERLHGEWKTLSAQLAEANEEKCRALVAAEDVKSKEVSLQYREKRMEEEREFLTAQVRTLNEELAGKNEECMQARREAITKSSELRARLEETAEELRMAEARESARSEDLQSSEARVEELTERLKSAREAEFKLEETFRQEVQAQTKLAELYQSHNTDSEAKAEELSNAVKELQAMLKESADRYGALENSLEGERAEHKEEIKKRNEAIKAMKKELDAANDLVKTLKNRGLTEEDVERLSPSAAAASKLLKGGVTLTQIYSQLVASQEELLAQRDENARLNTYMDQILKEIESRAPGLKRQKEDFDRAVAAVDSLTRQLEEARQEHEFRKREADDNRKRNATLERENERMLMQVHDMGRQVTTLTMEVEASRSGTARRSMSGSGAGDSMNRSMDADGVITDRLLSFKDVEELQRKNIELVAVVRELSSNKETVENRLVEEKTAELKSELETAMQQVEELRAARQRQEVMFESIIVERDMYKTVVDNSAMDRDLNASTVRTPAATSTPGGVPAAAHQPPQTPVTPSPRGAAAKTSGSYQELEKKATAAQAALDEVQKDFDTYRTEKCENERMLNEELKTLRESLAESRSKAQKLATQEEYNTERFKIAQANCASFKKQCQLLEDRNAKLNGIVAKHEQASETIRSEAMDLQAKLSHAEVQLEFLRHEKSVLKAAEARLLQENEILRRQKNSSELVMENLNLIKLNLERAESEKAMRLQNRADALEKEVALLRKKADADRDSHAESIKAWEAVQKDLTAKLEAAKDLHREVEERLNAVTAEKEEVSQKLAETSEKLVLAESTLSSRGVTAIQRQESQTEASAKYRDLQLQLNQSKNECNNLKQQVANTKQASLQYKEIADSAEKRLAENNNAAKALKDDLDARLKAALEEKAQADRRLAEMEEAARAAPVSCEGQLRESLALTQQNLQSVSEQLAAAQRVEAESRAEAERQAALATEAHLKYQNEIVQHARDVETLNELKASSASQKAQADELEEARRAAEMALAEAKANLSSVEQAVRAEYDKLKEQFAVVEKENESLHGQLATVTNQMTSLQKHFEAGGGGGGASAGVSAADANRSFSEEESKSVEQLMEIIKFLRREKEILTGKVSVLQAESARVKSQLENAAAQAEAAQNALKLEREKSDSTAMSSTRHAELLEKVQTVSALTDSNRMLREERDRFALSVTELDDKLATAQSKLKPNEERIAALERREEELKVEIESLKADNQRWRQRADQLVEKQQLINPEEMKRLQNDNSNLTKQVTAAQAQLRQAHANTNAQNAKVKSLQEGVARLTAEAKRRQAELGQANLRAKNAETAGQTANSKLVAATARLTELEAASKAAIEEKAASAAREEKLTAAHKTQAGTIGKLKEVGRRLKGEKENALKEKLEVEQAKEKLQSEFEQAKKAFESQLAAAATASAASTSTSDADKDKELEELRQKEADANELLAGCNERIEELESQLAESADERIAQVQADLDKVKADLEKERAKGKKLMDVLKNAKQKVEAAKQERDEIKKELDDMKASGGSGEARGEPSKPSADSEQKIQSLQTELQAVQAELEEARERLQAEVDSKQQKAAGTAKKETPAASETVTVSVKPMATPQQPPARKAAVVHHHNQPQAHIQPTRHVPATATIRPQSQRTVAGVRPTIVSVSPNSASQTTAAAAPLNPTAPEFTPRQQQTQGVAIAAVRQRQDSDSDGAATVGPPGTTATPAAVPGPSTSRASVPPTQKRPREDDSAQAEDEAKKARTGATAAAAPVEAATAPATTAPSVVTIESGDGEVVLDESEAEPAAVVPDEEVIDVSSEDEGDVDPEELEMEEAAEEEEEDEEMEGDMGEDVEEVDDEEEDDDIQEVTDEPSVAEGAPAGADDVAEESQDIFELQGEGDTSDGQHQQQQQQQMGVDTGEGPSEQQMEQYQRQPSTTVTFEDLGDSVVPGTPKLIDTAGGAQAAQTAPDAFAGAFEEAAAAAASEAVAPALASQEVVNRTAVDFAQFVGDETDPTASEEALLQSDVDTEVEGTVSVAAAGEAAAPTQSDTDESSVIVVEPNTGAEGPIEVIEDPAPVMPTAQQPAAPMISAASMAPTPAAPTATTTAPPAEPVVVGHPIATIGGSAPAAPVARQQQQQQRGGRGTHRGGQAPSEAARGARGGRNRLQRTPIVWDNPSMGGGQPGLPPSQQMHFQQQQPLQQQQFGGVGGHRGGLHQMPGQVRGGGAGGQQQQQFARGAQRGARARRSRRGGRM